MKNKYYILLFLLIISCINKEGKLEEQRKKQERVSFAIWGANLKEFIDVIPIEDCDSVKYDWNSYKKWFWFSDDEVKLINPRCDSLEMIIKPYPIKEYKHKEDQYIIYYHNKTFYYYKLVKKQTLENTHYIVE